MLRLKPNLNLVDNDCFVGYDVICDYRNDMTFEELIEALMYGRYGKVAYNPTVYSIDEQYMIRKMAERSFTTLLEFPSSNIPFGNMDSIFSNPFGVQNVHYVPRYPESVVDDFDLPFGDEPEDFDDGSDYNCDDDLCWKDSHTAMDKSGRIYQNLCNEDGAEIDILRNLTNTLSILVQKLDN